MALDRFIDATLEGPISTIRRQAIAIAICAAAAIGAIFYLADAAALALEPHLGAALARLAVGLGFMIIATAAILAPRMFRNQGVVARAQAETEDMTREQKLTLIIEALLAGFSLSSARRSQAANRSSR